MAISVCDVFDCKTCTHRLKRHCPGCGRGNRIQQAEGGETCAIYQCAVSKQIKSCKECSSPVCPFPRNLEIVCPIRDHFEKKRCYTRKLSDHFGERQQESTDTSPGDKISEKVITRLRWYLFALDEFLARGITRVSSEDISHKSGVKDYLIRHDLSQFGGFGRPSIGYDAAFLRSHLVRILHADETNRIVWIGADSLKSDSLLAKRFQHHGFDIVGIFDIEPSKATGEINGLAVKPLSDLADTIRDQAVQGAIIAVPQDEAQAVADMLVAAGIRGILNLTSSVIIAPPGVHVRQVDVVAEMFALCHHCH